MDKELKLYSYIDGINDTPFPSSEDQAIITSFQYDSKRMGGAPTISATLMHEQCLDKLWTYNVYAQFNGERYFVKQIPSSQRNNTDILYKHELELVSERVVLDNVYFYDVVSADAENDKPVSNSTKFTFFGDIHEFAKRLNYSLQYRKVGYSVVVDEGISSEGKLVSFEDTVFSNAIQESYNTYEIPYYFVGKVIHFGFTDNAITNTFKYGADESLLSIQKNNANYKVVTRITGTGSSDNIPYYYPNDSEQGTLTLLYNGIESSNVVVADRVKFSNLLLENKLEYTYVPSTTKELMSGLTVQSYVDISDDSSSERIFEFSIMSKFTMPAASIINMSFVIGYNKGTYVRITNSSGTEQASRTITKTADNISMQLGSGVFTLIMTARVAIPEGVDITSMAEAQEWVNNRMSASAKYTSQSSSYWTLNGTVIYLADYGLELSSGFTPTNGDYITIRQDNYIQPSGKLLPPIYRQTNGAERFYEAKNNTYINSQTGEYYHFNNEFIEGNPREHIVSFEDIKPTIKGMTNSLGYRIDMFQEFAYDLNDNDDTYPEGSDKAGEYIHPYFFAKLRKFDGEYGFNLFDHAIDEGEMTISMTSGNCGACEWVIGVDENTQKNIVQVDSDGNLYRDEEGNVLLGAPQDRQNDTQNNEVWIALKKDINTFGVIMPNATYNYKPSVNDTFVILHIDLPKAYVLAAENRLKEELIKYMAENNDEKFNFSISFSRIFFAENPDILAKLNENARLQIEYDGITYELYVSSYSYKMSNDSPLPEIQVELSETLTVSQNSLQTAIDKVEQDIMRNVGSIDWLKLGLAYFLRKDQDDRSKGAIASDKQLEVGRYVSGVSGAVIYVDKETGRTVGELDKLYVRMKAYFEQLEIVNVNNIGGKQILSPFGAIKCNKVVTEEGWDYYRCYFLSEQDGEKVENRFKVGAQAYSKMFNAKEGVSNKISNRYYWRLVVGVGEDYIDLSKDDCDSGSDIPEAGDVICHRGHRTDVDYQNFIEMSSVDSFSPSITLYQGVNSYSIVDKEVVQFGVNKATGKAFMNVYGDMYLGNRDGSAYISYTPEGGLKIKGTLDIGTGFGNSTLKDVINEASTTYVEDLNLLKQEVDKNIKNIQSQLDGAIETWFFDPAPTLENAPAKDWTTDEDKNTHLGDLYYSGEGKAYRFQLNSDTGEYYWKEINDTSVQEALEAAKKAQDTADGKRKIFVRQPQAGEAYDIGDMWVNATYPSDGSKYKEDMLRAVTANDGTQPFDIAHWTLASKYTDDTVAKKAQEDATKANEKAEALGLTVNGMKNFTNTAFADGVIDRSEAKAIEAWIMQVDTLKKDVQKSYDDMATNSLLTGSTQLTTLTKAKDALITAASDLVDAINTAIADGKTTSAEKSTVDAKYSTFNDKYSDYTKALSACIRYVEEKLDKKISTYSYLKDALKEDTTIAGGLVQTTSVVLGYTNEAGEYVVMAGTNGLVTSKRGKTPALWMGGDMIDLFDVYNTTTGGFDKEDGVRYAQGMDRMDGTGYRANGNLWWDADGKVYADPLSFFVGESTVGGLIASFQVVLKADGVHPEYLIPQVPFQSLHVTNNLRLGDALIKYDPTNKAVYVTHPDGSTDTIGFYAEGWVSAKGANGSSSGGGGGASALYQLIDILPNATNDGVYGATDGSVLMYNGSKWQAGSVVTDISALTLQVNGTTLATFNGKSNVVANIAVPTKVSQLTNDSGYIKGITKAMVEGVLTGNITSHTHSYLPLTGGTMAGNITMGSSYYIFGINETGGAILQFDGSKTVIGSVGDSTTAATAIRSKTGHVTCGTTGTQYTMLDSGNYNSYAPTKTGTGASGTWAISIKGNAATATDADKLDGLHNGEVTAKYFNYVAGGFDCDEPTATLHSDYTGSVTIANQPSDWHYGQMFTIGRYGTMSNALSAQMMWDVRHGTTYAGRLWFRTKDSSTGWRGWAEVLTEQSGNAVSATKLQTARTLWGQTFDGTANVSGSLTDVTNITASGTVTISGINERYIVYGNSGYGFHVPTTGGWATGANVYDSSNTLMGYYAGAYGNLDTLYYYFFGGTYTSPLMVILPSGNVGIGNTSPAYKLDVTGSIRATDSITANSVKIGDCTITYDSVNKGLKLTTGLYSESYISAKGAGTSSGGGGGASALYQLVDVKPNGSNDGVYGASAGKALMYNGTKWEAMSVLTSINTLTLQVNGTSLATYNGKDNVVANIAIPTRISQLTDDVLATRYLPLSGGTMTGQIRRDGVSTQWIKGRDNAMIRMSSLNAYSVLASLKTTNGTWEIGAYNNSAYTDDLLLTYCTDEDYSNGNNVATAQVKFYEDGTIGASITGNAATASKWATARTLTLTGSVTGSVTMDGSGNVTLATTTSHTHTKAQITDFPTSLKNPYAITIQANGTSLGSYDGSSAKTINLTYSNVGAAAASHTHSYLPLSGGTMTGSITMEGAGTHIVCRMASDSSNYRQVPIWYSSDGATKLAEIGYHNTVKRIYINPNGSSEVWNDAAGKYSLVVGENLLTWNTYTVLHSSNYNSYAPTLKGAGASGTWGISITGNAATATNADKLDGLHNGEVTAKHFNYATGGFDCDAPTATLHSDYSGTATIANHPSDWHYGQLFTIGRYGTLSNALSAQMMWDVRHGTTYAGRLWFRTKDSSTGWRGWAEVLTEQSGNAVSATKLQTARTLWGKTFDGTANVSGDLSSVASIYMTGNIFNGNSQSALSCSTSYTILGYGTSQAGLNTYVDGNIIYLRCGTGHSPAMTITADGNVGIGTTSPACKLYVSGDMAATGGVTAKASSSDIRLKKDIREYNAMELIRRHRSIKYHWNETAKANADIFNDDYWHFGLIAQEVQHDLPQMVSNVFGDYLVIQYERLLPIMWRGLQEVDSEIDKLKRRVKILESTAANWQRRANKLEMELNEIRQNMN